MLVGLNEADPSPFFMWTGIVSGGRISLPLLEAGKYTADPNGGYLKYPPYNSRGEAYVAAAVGKSRGKSPKR